MEFTITNGVLTHVNGVAIRLMYVVDENTAYNVYHIGTCLTQTYDIGKKPIHKITTEPKGIKIEYDDNLTLSVRYPFYIQP